MVDNSDLDAILEAIRAEVRKIKATGHPAGRAAGAGLKSKLRGFRFFRKGRVRAGRLLRFHDEEFIRKVYLALLNRQPDPEGLLHWLGMMNEEGCSRIVILRMISESEEGRIHNVPIRGLKIRSAARRAADGLRAVPVLGQGLARLRMPPRRPGAQKPPDPGAGRPGGA